jgi:hypothetical protein
MCLYCKEGLTDGFVPAEEIGVLAYPLPLEHANQLAKQLASVGLTKEASKDGAQGWQVLAYVKRNGTKEDVERLSQVRAEAGRKGGRPPGKTAGRKPAQANRNQVAKQNKSRANPKTESETESGKDLQEPTVPAAPGSNQVAKQTANPERAKHAGDVVAAFVSGAVNAGQPEPATSLRARVGKQARQMLAEGYDAETLINSARNMGAGEWNDLAVQVRKDAAAATGGTSKPGGHQPYRNPDDPSVYDLGFSDE